MPSPKSAAPDRAASPARPSGLGPAATCIVAWLIPGGAHFLHGQTQKAIVLCVALVAMFTIGIAAGGRLFPFQASDVLVFLAAGAQWALGLPRFMAALAGYGAGAVTSASYEYGNTFLITAGLLNTLVVLDAFDLSTHRKPS